MLINEKGLVRALKHAYKHGGYVIINQEDQVILYTSGWYIRADWGKFPIKALATIVEHMGSLPTSEGALDIAAGGEPQVIMPEKAGDDVADWIADGSKTTVTMVPVVYEGLQVYQTEAGAGPCYAVDPMALAILERDVATKKQATVVDPYRMAWHHDGEDVIITAQRPGAYYWEDYHKEVWTALEGVDLHPRPEG